MPELPEVETIRTAVASAVVGARITSVAVNRDKIRLPIPADFKQIVESATVVSVTRRAKYIFILLDNRETIVVHLGMSGKITLTRDYVFRKHDHLVFYFDNGLVMSYNDARRFGFVSLLKCVDLSNLGVDALDEAFNATYLRDKIAKLSAPIKTVMLDQSVVGGIGNIYIIESLFKSGISPFRPAKSLRDAELEKLVCDIKDVLIAAIACGGTTLRDYRKASGELGYFQNKLAVYGKEGQPCPHCSALIRRAVQGGRSTFYCPECQR